jgi:hypothetical protein
VHEHEQEKPTDLPWRDLRNAVASWWNYTNIRIVVKGAAASQ